MSRTTFHRHFLDWKQKISVPEGRLFGQGLLQYFCLSETAKKHEIEALQGSYLMLFQVFRIVCYLGQSGEHAQTII